MSESDNAHDRIRSQIRQLMSWCMTPVRDGRYGSLYEAFADEKTVELMCNPDGKVYLERLGEKPQQIGNVMPSQIMSLIRNVSGYLDQIVDSSHPICEGEFPLDGSRFEGLIPPVVAGASFSLRKKAVAVFTLDQYVDSGIMTPVQREVILQAITDHRNILVAGGTGSGKTTLINGIIDAMVRKCPGERVVIIEDTGEIQCSARNHVQMRSTETTSMTRLLRATLRYRPDRILVGEVRGPEALDLLDAWNTGHPGGFATLHANGATEALYRLESLVSRNSQHPEQIQPLVGEAVHLVIYIARAEEGGRKVRQILKVRGWSSEERRYLTEQIA